MKYFHFVADFMISIFIVEPCLMVGYNYFFVIWMDVGLWAREIMCVKLLLNTIQHVQADYKIFVIDINTSTPISLQNQAY